MINVVCIPIFMPGKLKDKGVSWRIPEELRKRINTKAEWRGQTAEEFVIECMEANTRELKSIQRKIVKERESGKKPIFLR